MKLYIKHIMKSAKIPSLPPSRIITPSPAGKPLASGLHRRPIAAAKSLACLPSRRGGRRNVGCVCASPHTFVSFVRLLWAVAVGIVFPTCQVRVVRFYVSCLLLLLLLVLLLLFLIFSTTIHASVPCRTSTASIHAQCSLQDLNRDHPGPVFPDRMPEYMSAR